MVALFTTKQWINHLTHSSDSNVWLAIMQKLGKVYVDKKIERFSLSELKDIEKKPELYERALEDNIIALKTEVEFDESRADYINSLVDEPKKVLEEPCGIFILDIDEVSAKKIQNDFGVIYQSTSNPSHSQLTHFGKKAELSRGKKYKNGSNWEDILQKFKATPVNSAIIVDAYLFENDQWDEEKKDISERYNSGISNLHKILDEILPRSFGNVFHVGVFLQNYDFERKEKEKIRKRASTNLTNEQIAKTIRRLKKKLKRNYSINFEVYFLGKTYGWRELIHNRRIFTNTFFIEAPYKLSAFNKKGNSKVSQTITVSPLFELIQMDDENDFKSDRLIIDLDEFNTYTKSQIKGIGIDEEVYQNDKKLDSLKIIKHRFINREIIKEMKTQFLQTLKEKLEDQGKNLIANKIYNLKTSINDNWITISLGHFPHNDERGTFGLEGILAGKGSNENPFTFDLYISTWFKRNSDDYAEERKKKDLEYLKKLFPDLTFEYPYKARFKGKLTDYKWTIDQEEETINLIVSDWLKWQGEIEEAIKEHTESQTETGVEDE